MSQSIFWETVEAFGRQQQGPVGELLVQVPPMPILSRPLLSSLLMCPARSPRAARCGAAARGGGAGGRPLRGA